MKNPAVDAHHLDRGDDFSAGIGRNTKENRALGSNHFRVDMPRLVEFYMRGKLHLEDWISAKLKLSEINEGFANMKAGKTLRSVIMFDS